MAFRASEPAELHARCGACRAGEGFPIPFAMALPAYRGVATGGLFAYEALVRAE